MVGEVASASVATGVLGVGGNKGAVALGFTLHRRRVAFIASHFAAHQARTRSGGLRFVSCDGGTSAGSMRHHSGTWSCPVDSRAQGRSGKGRKIVLFGVALPSSCPARPAHP